MYAILAFVPITLVIILMVAFHRGSRAGIMIHPGSKMNP